MLRSDELDSLRQLTQGWFPLQCTVTRPGDGGSSGAGTPCAIQPDTRQVYPFNAIPDQPVQRWQVHLPADTDVQPNDLLTVADGRVYVVLYLTDPAFSLTRRVALSVLSAAPGAPLGSAYLRANATVTCTRPGQVSGGRRVHLTFPQANPSAPLERIQAGAVSLRATFFDLPDADWTQGDGFTIEQTDGVSPFTRLDVATFTVQGVLRRPLPYTILEADLVAPIA